MASANSRDDVTAVAGQQIKCNANGANGEATITFYLQHDQTLIIKHLPYGAKYTVTEVPEDYRPSFAVSGDTTNGETSGSSIASGQTSSVSDTFLADDTAIVFTNTRDGVIPTGVAASSMPYLLPVLIAAAGLVAILFANERRRRTNE